jgi:hypothetical protein
MPVKSIVSINLRSYAFKNVISRNFSLDRPWMLTSRILSHESQIVPFHDDFSPVIVGGSVRICGENTRRWGLCSCYLD